MKLLTSIAAIAAVIGGSLIASAIPASAYERYRVTPTFNGGYRINGSNGYSGRYTPGYNGGTCRDSNGNGYRYRSRYGGGGTYTFY